MKRFYFTIALLAVVMFSSMSVAAYKVSNRPVKHLGAGLRPEALLPQRGSHESEQMRRFGYELEPFGGLDRPSLTVGRIQAPSRVEALPEGFKMYGALISSEPYPGRPNGVYGFDDEALEEVFLDAEIFKSIYGAVHCGDKYWVVTPNISGSELVGMTYYTLDTKTWKKVGQTAGNIYFSPNGMGYDPVTNDIYVCGAYLDSSYYLGSIDISTGTVYHIADMGSTTYKAIAFNSSGEMYAIKQTKYNEPVQIVKVDKLTGAEVEAHDTNLRYSAYMASACIDDATGKFYYTVNAYDPDAAKMKTRIWDVDQSSGTATAMFDTPEGALFAGMWIPSAPMAGNVPAKAENLTADFTDDSLEGTIAFTIPSTLNDGTEATTGEVNYIVNCNSVEIANSVAAYGETVTCPVRVDAAGTYMFTVSLSNENGKGKVASVTKYIGAALPSAASNVTLSYAEGVMTATWTAAAASGPGYFNPADVRYTVRLMPDDEVVAENIPELSVEFRKDAPESMTTYFVEVEAEYKGSKAGIATSNSVTLGSIVPPYVNNFLTKEDADGYVIEDTNKDGTKWNWSASDKALVVRYSSGNMDDWAFLPPVKMEGGKGYYFSFKTKAGNPNYPERIELQAGTAPASAAMTTVLIDKTDVKVREWTELKSLFVPQETGIYYFGIHGCSDADKLRLLVTDIAISEPISGSSPAAVTNLKAERDATGALTATVSLTAPTEDSEGNLLESISRIEVIREEKVAHTFDNPAPGAELSFVDNLAQSGPVAYTVVAYNEYGAGLTAEVSTFVGFGKPAMPVGLAAAHGSTDSEAIVTWNAVSQDINGYDFPEGAVTYNVYRVINGKGVLIAEKTSNLTVTDSPYTPETEQNFVLYAVEAEYENEKSDLADSPVIPLGKPYSVPFGETFNPTNPTYNWALGYSNEGTYWGMIDKYQGVVNQDENGGMAVMVGQYIDATAMLYSGSIKVEAGNSLSFYYYDYPSSNTMDVMINDGTGYKQAKAIALSGENAPKQWKRVIIDLSSYSGKNIQLGFQGVCVDTKWMFVDNVFVGVIPQYDLAVKPLNAPESVATTEEEFTVTTTVMNNGLDAFAEGQYDVALYVNGSRAEAAPGVAIAGGEEAVFAFTIPVGVFTDDVLVLSAKIETALADADASNNETAAKEVTVIYPEYPVVTGLTATASEDGVSLAWAAPVVDENAKRSIVDSAENYTVFSTGLADSDAQDDNVGDWIMVDKDGSYTYGINDNYGQPIEYPNAGGRMAFQVFDGEKLGLAGWAAHSGRQMFVCFAAENAPNDDWMISPELSGEAQEILFYAKSITLQYGAESLEFYYSMGSTETDDFIQVGDTDNAVQAEWALYKYEVPAGARRFAIHCVSDNRFALCVDDISFVAKDRVLSSLELTGYNVYCNGEKHNDGPVAQESYSAVNLPDGAHEFCVTAMYDAGESLPSEKVSVSYTFISSIAGSAVTIAGGEGEIIVNNAQGQNVAVYGADGRMIKSSDVTDEHAAIRIASGIYVVKAGGTIAKIIVR